MPEEELDDLFRKSASEFRPEYDPAAWQAMERKLDAYRLYPGFWQRFAWLTSLLLIMGLGFGVSFLLQQRQYQGPGRQVSAPSRPEPAQGPGKGSAPAPQASTQIPLPGPAAGKLAAPEQMQGRQPRQGLHQQDNKQPVSPGLTSDKPALRRQAFARQKQIPWASQGLQEPGRQAVSVPAGLPAPANLPAALTGLPPETVRHGQIDPAPAVLAGAPLATGKEVKADSLARAMPQPEPGALADSSATEKSPTPLRSRFSLRLLAAPDLSAVGLRKPEGLGIGAGIELRYQLRPRWYLTAGLLKVRKEYGAKPEDYGNSDYWYNRHLPDDIEAECQVLDLPLQIGYQLVSREKSAFTLHTGLSSYWMLSEDYYYAYTTGTPYSRTWSVRRENRHLFSIYNLSGLYTRRLTPGLEAGIEPFVKLPLAGVGAGKIKLASTGVYLSLGYRLR